MTMKPTTTAIVTAGRDTDLVFRYGGDEFTLLLPSTDRGGALQVADRVRATWFLWGGVAMASIANSTCMAPRFTDG